MGLLDGKVAIITGATSGIGERVAEVFVAEGAKTVLAGRRTAEGTALEQRLGANATFIRTDVSLEADVRAMFAHAVQRFGRVDILINNAGMTAQLVGIAELDMAHFDQVMAVNIRAAVLCMKHAARVMLPEGRGTTPRNGGSVTCQDNNPARALPNLHIGPWTLLARMP